MEERTVFEDILKPLSDRKAYRLVRLPSGMKALLVHTPGSSIENSSEGSESKQEELKAAAALAVQVGSYADPTELEGCAHFLEHMIFMGSHKYPKENEYDSFVSSNGGVCNAYTEGEYTVYHFDVNHSALPHALDLFAHCIFSPLLRQEAVDREIKAIQNEFKLAVLDDDSRLQQVLSHQVRADHVLHKFSWGNEASLRQTPESRGVDAYAKLVEFYNQFYRGQASQMTLCVVSGRSLDDMETLVRSTFDDANFAAADAASTSTSAPTQSAPVLSSRLASIADWPAPETLAVPTSACEQLTRIVAIKNTHRLVLTWQIPSVLTEYRTKPAQYIGHILGHECPGSLLARLKSKQWASKLVAGIGGSNFEDNSYQALFTVDIELTDVGLVHWIDVVALVNATLEHLRHYKEGEQAGLPTWIFEEMQQLAQLTFDYMEEEEAEDIAERLAVQCLPLLQRHDRDVVAAPYLFFDWSPATLSSLLAQYCGIRQAKIILLSRAFQSDGDEDEEDDQDDEDEDGSDFDDDDDDDEDDDDEDDDGEEEVDTAVLEPDRIAAHFDLEQYPFLTYVLAPEPPATDGDDDDADADADGHVSIYAQLGDRHVADVAVEEPYFHVKYWNKPISAALYAYWDERGHALAATEASLPPPNPYVPRDLSLLPSAESPADTSPSAEPQTKRPRLAASSVAAAKESLAVSVTQLPVEASATPLQLNNWLYHCADTRFDVPKVEVFVEVSLPADAELQLTQPLTQPSPAALVQQAVCSDILVAVAKDALTSSAWYMAELAGLDTDLTARPSSVVFSVRGFHEHALTLLRTSLDALFALSPAASGDNDLLADDGRLERIVRNVVRKKYVDAQLTAQQVAQEMRLAALMVDDVASADRLAFLDDELLAAGGAKAMAAVRQALLDYRQRLRRAAEVHVMVHGHVGRDKATREVAAVVQRFRQLPSDGSADSGAAATAAASKKKSGGRRGDDGAAVSSPHVPEHLLARALRAPAVSLVHRYAQSALEENTAIEVYFQFPPLMFTAPLIRRARELQQPAAAGGSKATRGGSAKAAKKASGSQAPSAAEVAQQLRDIDTQRREEEAAYFAVWMALQLLEQHWSEPFFDRLRSQLQLGYLVDCSIRETRQQLGMCLRVVSATHNATQLLTHVLDDFVRQQLGGGLFDAAAGAATAATAATQKPKKPAAPVDAKATTAPAPAVFTATKLVESLLARKQQPDVSIGDAAQRHWSLVEDRLLDWRPFASAGTAAVPSADGTAAILNFQLRERQVAFLQSLLQLPDRAAAADAAKAAALLKARELRLQRYLRYVAEWLLLGRATSAPDLSDPQMVVLERVLTRNSGLSAEGVRLLVSIAEPKPSHAQRDGDEADGAAAAADKAHDEAHEDAHEDDEDSDNGTDADREHQRAVQQQCQDILRSFFAPFVASGAPSQPSASQGGKRSGSSSKRRAPKAADDELKFVTL